MPRRIPFDCGQSQRQLGKTFMFSAWRILFGGVCITAGVAFLTLTHENIYPSFGFIYLFFAFFFAVPRCLSLWGLVLLDMGVSLRFCCPGKLITLGFQKGLLAARCDSYLYCGLVCLRSAYPGIVLGGRALVWIQRGIPKSTRKPLLACDRAAGPATRRTIWTGSRGLAPIRKFICIAQSNLHLHSCVAQSRILPHFLPDPYTLTTLQHDLIYSVSYCRGRDPDSDRNWMLI